MSRTILAIGANSTLAQAVLPLLAKNNTIITAGRSNCDVYCDIKEAVVIPDSVDTVINFAASFGGESDDDIMSAVQTNVLGALRICQAAHTAGNSQVVNISSMFAILQKEDPQHSIYALTKRHADELTSFYCQSNGVPLTVLRPSRIYGDDEVFSKGQPFLYKMIDTAEKGEGITLYGDRDPIRNYIHTDDLAEILLRVIQEKVTGIYECAHPHDTTYSQIATVAQNIFENGEEIERLEDKPNAPNDVVTHDESLYEKIKYRPVISIEAGIERIKQCREGNTR